MYYQRLRDLKEDSDLTQKQVAEIIGVSVNHYGKYERGETDIPFEKAVKLAEYYNVSLDYLAGRTNEMRTGHTMLSSEQRQIAETYACLSEKIRGSSNCLRSSFLKNSTKKALRRECFFSAYP